MARLRKGKVEWGDPVRYLARYLTGFPAEAWLLEARPEREREIERERERAFIRKQGGGRQKVPRGARMQSRGKRGLNNLECEGKEVSIGFRNPHLVYLYSTDTRRAKVHRGVCVCVCVCVCV